MIAFKTILFLRFALAAASAASGGVEVRDSACQAVHIFLAGGNNEPYPGRQSAIVTAVCTGLSSCDYEDILYVHTLESAYCGALEDGVGNGTAQITAYNKRCPDAKLVLSGYSQGAHIIGDILGGGGGTFFQDCVEKTTSGLDSSTAPGNKIAAALIFGDTRHTADQSYNVLTGAASNGLFPRPANQLAGLNRFSAVTHSYCVSTDPICAGGKDVATHLNYFDIYSDAAGAWVKSMVGTAAVQSSSTSVSVVSTTRTTQSTTAEQQTTSISATGTSSSSAPASGKTTSTSAITTSSSSSSLKTDSPTSVSSIIQSANLGSPVADAGSAASTSAKANGAKSIHYNVNLISLVIIGSLGFLLA